MILIRLHIRIFLILFISTCYYGCATSPPLISAAYDGDINSVRKLISEGDNVNQQGGSWHETALNAASRQGHIEVVRVLLDSGADPNISTKYGGNALTGATWKCYPEIAKLLIEKGVEINQCNYSHGSSPLMLAAECNDIELVRFLLDNGARTDLKNKSGDDALMAASRKGYPEIVKILLAYGANVHSTGWGYQTALYQAAENGHISTLSVLLDRGADINHQSEESCRGGRFTKCTSETGWTALMIASAEGHSDAVHMLLARGADPNIRNHYGRTALMYAANYGYVNIARYLIQYGAIVDTIPEDDTGWNALIVASAEGNIEVVGLLLDNKADTTIRDRKGRTALEWAKRLKHREIVKLLENY